MQSFTLYKPFLNEINMGALLEERNVNVNYWSKGWIDFCAPAGEQHYRLLAYLSLLFSNELIVDLGTCVGASALALSYSEENSIVSFDVPTQHYYNVVENTAPNICYIRNNFFDYPDILKQSSFICLDIDHEGPIEKNLVNFLNANNWKGMMLIDDTLSWGDNLGEIAKMSGHNAWDLTKYGHSAGTHLVDFSDSWKLIYTL